ncbi:hypothetical protein, partial [Allobaculum mucilyticum]|uniref:hypothetical protein n=1 Tax=Allobaculum mucilyticum TaxID=2834459 RepID=UPI001E32215B
MVKIPSEKLIVNFGDAWFLSRFLEIEGLDHVLKSIDCANADSFFSMILYYVLEHRSNTHAEDWYQSSYCRYLFPEADLSSQRISELLEQLGSEENWRLFF